MTTLLKPREAAVIINCSVRTLENLVRAGKLRQTRVPAANGSGTLPRYTRADVDAYLASGYRRGVA